MTDTETSSNTETERIHTAVPASGGLAIGPLAIVGREVWTTRASGTSAEETEALTSAIASATVELQQIIAAEDRLGADILEFQAALLEDEELVGPVFDAIAAGTPADDAWGQALDREIAEYKAAGDDYMAARSEDLVDLKCRVLAKLHGEQTAAPAATAGAILVAEDLTPSRFLEHDWSALAGAAIRGGSPSSHVAILARARNVNLVVGLDAELAALAPGTPAVLDAAEGRLVECPSDETLSQAKARLAAQAEETRTSTKALVTPARTGTGKRINVLLNIDTADLLDKLDPATCDGIGLVRTEFLYRPGHLPDEEQQVAFYRRLLLWADGRPVTVRTLDAGGDKPVAGVTVDGETNPFLGVRGVRLSLTRPALLKTQLRALARAGAVGPLKVMVPMVTVPNELQAVGKLLNEAIEELRAAGLDCARPELGMMVEVPAAALTAERFEADFYSIGSNDLIQYALAAARDNPSLAHLADPAHPAVAELIARVVEAGRKRGVSVSLCGDMASQPRCIAALLSLGLTDLSVAPAQLGRIKLEIGRYGKDA